MVWIVGDDGSREKNLGFIVGDKLNELIFWFFFKIFKCYNVSNCNGDIMYKNGLSYI